MSAAVAAAATAPGGRATRGNEGERLCSHCDKWLPRDLFSGTQWAKAAASRRCTACVSGGPGAVVAERDAGAPLADRAPGDGAGAPGALSEAALAACVGGDDAGAPSDDDAQSVATSAVTIESTQHLRARQTERCIDRRELQKAIKHGTRSRDQATGHLHYFYDGICYVTDETGKVGITSWVEDSARGDRPARVVFMKCSGHETHVSCPPNDRSAALAAAAELLRKQVEGRTPPPFRLVDLKSKKALPEGGCAPGQEVVVLLLGPYLDVSPICQESYQGQHLLEGGERSRESYRWKMPRAPSIRNEMFILAMQLSVGVPVLEQDGGDPGAERREQVEQALAKAEGRPFISW